MRVECFHLGDDLQLLRCDYENAFKATGALNDRMWVDVQGVETDALDQILDRFGITGLAGRLCREAGERPGVYPMKGVTFIVIPVQAATGSPRDVEYVALLAREDLLLTLHEGPSNVLAGPPPCRSWPPGSPTAVFPGSSPPF
jgi:Mg2+ and Co2+ transporter CorA